jgi:hypothetical protein
MLQCVFCCHAKVKQILCNPSHATDDVYLLEIHVFFPVHLSYVTRNLSCYLLTLQANNVHKKLEPISQSELSVKTIKYETEYNTFRSGMMQINSPLIKYEYIFSYFGLNTT